MIYFAIVCSGLLLYTYVGYPVIVSLLARFRPRASGTDSALRPAVSIILAAYNEELVLRRCLNSLVALEYPVEKLEILCGSDGSTDSTNAILNEYALKYSWIHPVLFAQRRGKMLTLNDLVARARNEILVFVDADIALSPNSILSFVRHFADPQAGAVAGHLTMTSNTDSSIFRAEDDYWDVESRLRENESKIGSTVGLYGGNYAIRRELWSPLPDGRVSDDFFVILDVVSKNRRVLFEPEAISYELFGRTSADEFHRKRRTTGRTLHTLFYFPGLLFKGPIAWRLWPHKFLRWIAGLLMPFAVAAIFAVVFNHTVPFLALLLLTIICLLLLAAAHRLLKRPIPILSQISWLALMNVALTLGLFDFLLERGDATWKQTTRVGDASTQFPKEDVSRV